MPGDAFARRGLSGGCGTNGGSAGGAGVLGVEEPLNWKNVEVYKCEMLDVCLGY